MAKIILTNKKTYGLPKDQVMVVEKEMEKSYVAGIEGDKVKYLVQKTNCKIYQEKIPLNNKK